MSSDAKMLVVHQGEALIAIPMEIGGEEVTALFATEQAADSTLVGAGVQEALELAGAWSDLDFDEMVDELDRVRHASPPSPPIDL